MLLAVNMCVGWECRGGLFLVLAVFWVALFFFSDFFSFFLLFLQILVLTLTPKMFLSLLFHTLNRLQRYGEIAELLAL